MAKGPLGAQPGCVQRGLRREPRGRGCHVVTQDAGRSEGQPGTSVCQLLRGQARQGPRASL